jgi:hypothetical protein
MLSKLSIDPIKIELAKIYLKLLDSFCGSIGASDGEGMCIYIYVCIYIYKFSRKSTPSLVKVMSSQACIQDQALLD